MENYCLRDGGCLYAPASAGWSRSEEHCCYMNCQSSTQEPSVSSTPSPTARPSTARYAEISHESLVCTGERVLVQLEQATSYYLMLHPDHNLEAALGDKLTVYAPNTQGIVELASFPTPSLDGSSSELPGLDGAEPLLLLTSSFEVGCITSRVTLEHEPLEYRLQV